jgi:hypothetical protein
MYVVREARAVLEGELALMVRKLLKQQSERTVHAQDEGQHYH